MSLSFFRNGAFVVEQAAKAPSAFITNAGSILQLTLCLERNRVRNRSVPCRRWTNSSWQWTVLAQPVRRPRLQCHSCDQRVTGYLCVTPHRSQYASGRLLGCLSCQHRCQLQSPAQCCLRRSHHSAQCRVRAMRDRQHQTRQTLGTEMMTEPRGHCLLLVQTLSSSRMRPSARVLPPWVGPTPPGLRRPGPLLLPFQVGAAVILWHLLKLCRL